MNTLTRATLIFVLGLLAAPGRGTAGPAVPPDHAANRAASQRLFADKVRPWLEKNCLACHGGEKVRSGFSLASRQLLLKGADKGAAVVPGRSGDSPLVRYIAHQQEPHMPPKKPAAERAVVEAVARWVDL